MTDIDATKKETAAEEEYRKFLSYKSGGRYVPPSKLQSLLDQINFSKDTEEYQKLQWESLKKNINGSINKANVSNLRPVIMSLFQLNLMRGMGVVVKSIMKAQSLAVTFSSVYACLICVLNSKIPRIGELLVSRLILLFKKAYKRNNKQLCISSTAFLGQLVNQRVAHEIIILQIIYLLLNKPTDDSIMICCSILKQSGALLAKVSPTATTQIFEKLRTILQEGKLIGQKALFAIEALLLIRKEGYVDFPIIPEGLDLVEDSDLIIHKLALDDKLKAEDSLNVFKFDENYEENEIIYSELRKEILGEEDDTEEENDNSEKVEGEANEYDETYANTDENETLKQPQETTTKIHDLTATNTLNFQKTIYLILKGSMSPDEAVHKLLKLKVSYEDEPKVLEMILKSCYQETTYSKYYGMTAEKLSLQSKSWTQALQEIFKESYETVHRLESTQLRNGAKFWGHLLSCGALDWDILAIVRLTEADTSASGRVFIKFMFQELVEELGVEMLQSRLNEDFVRPYLEGLFPVEDADHLRFSINYFTAIGLGVLTEDMRESLQRIMDHERGRSYSRSRSRSYSRSYSRSRSRSFSRSPSPRRPANDYDQQEQEQRQARSPSRSRSRSRSRSFSRSRSPIRQNQSRSRERSHLQDQQRYSRSQSPSYNRNNYQSRYNNNFRGRGNNRG